jgi:hypothetical protein
LFASATERDLKRCALLLPACGEKVGMRGRFRSAQARGHAPSPGLLRNPTSPRTAGRGKQVHARGFYRRSPGAVKNFSP